MNKNKLIRVMTALYCEPWLIVPEMHKTLSDIVQAHASDGEEEAMQHMLAAGMPANPARRDYDVVKASNARGQTANLAMIPIEGVIGRKFSSALQSSGVVSVDVLDTILRKAANDTNVDGIFMIFDTPGGTASGLAEVTATMNEVKKVKPITAYADGMMASAGYWIASQADQIYATESADVGSIGVYMAVLDRTRQLEAAGLKVDMFKSGKHKGMGYPGTQLTDEQRVMLQERVDNLGTQFRAVVRAGRERDIKDECMQGQSFDAVTATANGLIDGVCNHNAAMGEAVLLINNRLNRRTA